MVLIRNQFNRILNFFYTNSFFSTLIRTKVYAHILYGGIPDYRINGKSNLEKTFQTPD